MCQSKVNIRSLVVEPLVHTGLSEGYLELEDVRMNLVGLCVEQSFSKQACPIPFHSSAPCDASTRFCSPQEFEAFSRWICQSQTERIAARALMGSWLEKTSISVHEEPS